MSTNDRDLLLRFARNRDQDAFGLLVRQYIGLVYHSALRRVGDAHAAEDIAQQLAAHDDTLGGSSISASREAASDPRKRGFNVR